ncbi:hypothetical protein [Streptomyces halobius]|uniref:Uncharacterized protein n=1 Tax=Streptomyces halobius TaxID=2879846 RepID=A0ABY4MCK2_9ACTN|nr:hypothetical protein [Streptomyces halobius]UQA94135.1 hypothetical protein K9S39_21665 [Streptomyces halobius]
MFDRRAEAEMRLYSEQLATELALIKHHGEASDDNTEAQTPPPADESHATAVTTAATDAERDPARS